MEREWLTRQAACDWLDISLPTLDGLLRDRLLSACVRVGHQTRIHAPTARRLLGIADLRHADQPGERPGGAVLADQLARGGGTPRAGDRVLPAVGGGDAVVAMATPGRGSASANVAKLRASASAAGAAPSSGGAYNE